MKGGDYSGGRLGGRVGRGSGFEGLLEPGQFPTIQQHGVEAAGNIQAVSGQVMAGGQDDPGLLGGGDAFRRVAKAGMLARPDLDEHQYGAVGHDQIDFAAPTAVIALEQPEPLARQECGRPGFGLGTQAVGSVAHGVLPFRYTAGRIKPTDPMFDIPQPARPGTLYVVATPIGNLRDLSPHALDVLKSADWVAAEDTRTSQALLTAFGLQCRLIALHEHNEAAGAARLVAELLAGKSVAYISDAGTPGISDPGAKLVAAARTAGLPVSPVPGPSAVATALSVAGLEGPWLFVGFLPAKPAARRKALDDLRDLPYALVFYEAPHRIEACVADLVEVLGRERRLLLARELTKRFEQIHQCPLVEAGAWLAADENHRRGEFVLVLDAPHPAPCDHDPEARRVLEILLEELPLKQAAQLAARLTGGRKNALYDLALSLKQVE